MKSLSDDAWRREMIGRLIAFLLNAATVMVFPSYLLSMFSCLKIASNPDLLLEEKSDRKFFLSVLLTSFPFRQ